MTDNLVHYLPLLTEAEKEEVSILGSLLTTGYKYRNHGMLPFYSRQALIEFLKLLTIRPFHFGERYILRLSLLEKLEGSPCNETLNLRQSEEPTS